MQQIQQQHDTLTLLLVSDIHLQKYYLDKLRNWYLAESKLHPLKFDYVLVPGDTGIINYKDPGATSEKAQIEEQAQTSLVFEALQTFGCPILYIPGNHDALSLFDNKELTSHSQGIHKKWHQLAPTLRIFGFGGSVPSFVNGKKRWQGYPFQTEQSFKQEWTPVQPNVDHQPSQYILMVHVGPANSQTADDNGNQTISSGSQTLSKYVLAQPKGLMCVIHGHTHEATGATRLRRIPIVNPGSLSQGRFGILKLVKIEDEWGILQNRFINLNYSF